MTLLASCSAANEGRTSKADRGPVAHNAIVECILYDGMTKTSPQLTTVAAGSEVQVMDTVDAYFVKARVTRDGKVMNGYMYRTCFPDR
ncbi:hypothetical protein LJY25_13215 [Hymenobacter sp. BT175]|uniref:hypothetical protein n=1 Tax=Hymenobacter translucens TaxID=2886507 RepID=UPI001D0E4CED|nr:hypothetical protein [Hymenobacter translucens]MCC2547409.1 hypothetical protein [Hymenobacter translucens]